MKRARDDGAAAAAAKTKKKRRKKKKKAADSWMQSTTRHAFAVSPSDHAETPVNAYEDLAPFLRAVGGRVYDPYYCDGGVRRRLAALGFREVFNENRDFYADIQSKSVPRHDVLVTNPPYSGDLCGNQISDAPRHRPDVPVTASARWRGDSTPSTRRGLRSCGIT